MYSQNAEEQHLLDYLSANPGCVRNFLEVGAFAPKAFSNTRCLVELGWEGTYVEPAPSNFAAFLAEYRDEPRIKLVNAALASESKLVVFYDSGGDAVSTTSEQHVARWSASGVKFRPYWTSTITWDQMLDAVDCRFSVLSLDVESVNFELFMALPFDRLPDLRIIIVEHDGYQAAMEAQAARYGFHHHACNGENLIMVK